jgi:hypothetical protein
MRTSVDSVTEKEHASVVRGNGATLLTIGIVALGTLIYSHVKHPDKPWYFPAEGAALGMVLGGAEVVRNPYSRRYG